MFHEIGASLFSSHRRLVADCDPSHIVRIVLSRPGNDLVCFVGAAGDDHDILTISGFGKKAIL